MDNGVVISPYRKVNGGFMPLHMNGGWLGAWLMSELHCLFALYCSELLSLYPFSSLTLTNQHGEVGADALDI